MRCNSTSKPIWGILKCFRTGISSLLLISCLITHSLYAQERTISGKVTSSEDGVPLPGVNVIVKGTTAGTVSDIDGNYKVTVPEGAETLTFSFIGFTEQEVPINGQSTINIQMVSDTRQLSEVVVTAVGIERERKALGYAVTEIESERIAQRAEPDPVRALQGKVPGVNIIGAGGAVGSGTNITIRGNSSLLGNNQPLFVVDGVPFDNTTYATGSFTSATTAANRSFDLDPNNIESLTVLKGAAASALYGARAANGVIVVTTKAGRKKSNKGFEVSVNSSYSMVEVANLPDYQYQYMQGNNFKYVDGNYGTWGAPFAVDTTQGPWSLSVNKDLLIRDENGQIYQDDQGRYYVRHPYQQYGDRFPELADARVPIQGYNNAKDFFRTGNLAELGITVTGGDESANFTAGVSHTKEEGIVPENQVTRTSVNAGGNTQLENGLFLSGSLTYVNTDLTSPPTSGLFTGATSVTERLLFTPPNVNLAGYPIQDSEGNSAFYRPDNDNPYWLARYAPHTSKVDRYFGKVTVGYEIFDWLNVSYQAGFNAFTDRKMEVIPRGGNEYPAGRIIEDELARTELDGNLTVTMTHDLSEAIGLRAILGHNVNSRRVERQSYEGSGIIVRHINDLDNVESIIPNGGRVSERRYQGFYADLSLDYNDWLFLNLSGRNDVLSSLPKDEWSYLYYGASSSIIFTDALGIQSDMFNMGKLRLSYATVGNDIDPYLTQTYYLTNSGLGNNIAEIDFPIKGVNTQTLENTLGNANLKPERTREIELGTELRFFNSRFGIDFTYYNRKSTDQIVPVDVPPTTGYWAAILNIGEVTNKGVELGLDITPILTKSGFNWNLYGTFTRNRNQVEKIGSGLEEIFVNGFGNSVQVVHVEGRPYGLIKGSVAARSDDGQLLVDPNTGKLITKSEMEVIGDPNPDYIASLISTFNFKGFTLSGLLEYRKGGDMFSGTYNQVYGRGLTTGTIPDNPRGREVTLVIPGVIGDPNTQEAVLDENGNTIPNGTQVTVNDWYFINTFGSAGPDEFNVFDATTIRLREVSLGYTIPQTWLERTPFGSAHISITGRNLWFKAVNFPEDLNFDPDTNSLGAGNVEGLSEFQTGNAQGVDFGIIPTTRRYGVNLRFTF